MMGFIRQKLEDWLAAAAFAEAGDHETAKKLVSSRKEKRKTARKRAEKEKRAELRAPGM